MKDMAPSVCEWSSSQDCMVMASNASALGCAQGRWGSIESDRTLIATDQF